MKRLRWVLAAAVVIGGVATAWWRTRPPDPPPRAAEQRYEDIAREDYERWMQDLGYTE